MNETAAAVNLRTTAAVWSVRAQRIASGSELVAPRRCRQVDLAYVETLVGESDAAVKRLAYLLTIPSDISVPLLRVAAHVGLLRGNPGLQRLFATAR